VGIDGWREAVGGSTIRDLTNRSTMVRIGGATLCVAGVDDYALGEPSLEALPTPATRSFTILLAHNPDQAERCRRRLDDVDLILSGHTHGGQVRLPGYGPILTSVEHDDLYEDGLRTRPWTRVYTSRGLGTVHVPARLLARPEVSLLVLSRCESPEVAAK
jgi:uncharacterized protein